MIQKVLSFVKQHHMIEQGDHILAGVSGGADSVCLLLVLMQLQKMLGCTVTVAHVEHGIRGVDSLNDAKFVENLCKKLGVTCHVYRCDAVAFSGEKGMSLEEGARELRYQHFEELSRKIGANKIAIAHNQNDCAETLLFHLARGTGLKGMCGIVPVRDNIIRPLLCVSREEIEAFLQEEKQEFCLDATNLETEYSRNKIRHQVLPVLTEINAGAVEHLYRSTGYMAEALELVEQMTEQAREKYMEGQQKDCCLLRKEVTEQRSLIQETLVLELLGECAGSRKDLSQVHVEQVLELFKRQVGRRIMLPYGLQAVRTYEGVLIQTTIENQIFSKENNTVDMKKSFLLEDISETVEKNFLQRELWTAGQKAETGIFLEIPEYDLTVTARILQKTEEIHEIPQKKYTKWFDYDKIKGTLLLRNRCQGDYFIVDSKGSRQSLKKYFINEKIPAEKREQLPVLADGDHILWVIGYRISEAYKVTENTERILEIQVNGGSIHE